MKKRIPPIILFVLLIPLISFGQDEDTSPHIKVFKNDLDRVYTVFFGDTIARQVVVKLVDGRNKTLLEEQFQGKGFSKPYGLSSLELGNYEFIISYEGKEIRKPISIRSKQEILASEITIRNEYPALWIDTTEKNLSPMHISIFDMEDKLLKLYYWEPSSAYLSKKIDISVFKGYEARILIQQDDLDKIDQIFNLY